MMNDHVPDTSAEGISFTIETVPSKSGAKYDFTKEKVLKVVTIYTLVVGIA